MMNKQKFIAIFFSLVFLIISITQLIVGNYFPAILLSFASLCFFIAYKLF